MADHHVITGTLVYYIVRCQSCGETWEQPGVDLTAPGWLVCPHCIASAPAVPAEHDWNGSFCAICGADEAGSFAADPCPGFSAAGG